MVDAHKHLAAVAAILLAALALAPAHAQRAGTLFEISEFESKTDRIRAETNYEASRKELAARKGSPTLDLPRVVAIMGQQDALKADVRYGDGRRRVVGVGDALAARVTVASITPQEVIVAVPPQTAKGAPMRYMLEFANPQIPILPVVLQPGQPVPMPLAPVPEPLLLPGPLRGTSK